MCLHQYALNSNTFDRFFQLIPENQAIASSRSHRMKAILHRPPAQTLSILQAYISFALL